MHDGYTPLSKATEQKSREFLFQTSDRDGRRLSNTDAKHANVLMQDGGKANVPYDKWLSYLFHLAMDLVAGTPVYNNEKFPDPKEPRRMYNDLDYASAVGYESDGQIKEHARCIQSVNKEFHPGMKESHFLMVLTSTPNQPKISREKLPGGRVKTSKKFKTSRHAIFPLLGVNLHRFDTLILSQNDALEKRFPRDPSKGENLWKDINDGGVGTRGVRSAGCAKIDPCDECHGKDKSCKHCLGRGRLPVGRVHLPWCVLNGDGSENPELLRLLKQSVYMMLVFTSLHCLKLPDDLTLRGQKLWNHINTLNQNFKPRISRHWKKPLGAPEPSKPLVFAERDWTEQEAEAWMIYQETGMEEYKPGFVKEQNQSKPTKPTKVKVGRGRKFADLAISEEERLSLCANFGKSNMTPIATKSDLGLFLQRLLNDTKRVRPEYKRATIETIKRTKTCIIFQTNCRFCQNIEGEHSLNRVWFKIMRKTGSQTWDLYQKCHNTSRCDVDGSTVEVLTYTLSPEEAQFCFPNMKGMGAKQVSGYTVGVKNSAHVSVPKEQNFVELLQKAEDWDTTKTTVPMTSLAPPPSATALLPILPPKEGRAQDAYKTSDHDQTDAPRNRNRKQFAARQMEQKALKKRGLSDTAEAPVEKKARISIQPEKPQQKQQEQQKQQKEEEDSSDMEIAQQIKQNAIAQATGLMHRSRPTSETISNDVFKAKQKQATTTKMKLLRFQLWQQTMKNATAHHAIPNAKMVPQATLIAPVAPIVA